MEQGLSLFPVQEPEKDVRLFVLDRQQWPNVNEELTDILLGTQHPLVKRAIPPLIRIQGSAVQLLKPEKGLNDDLPCLDAYAIGGSWSRIVVLADNTEGPLSVKEPCRPC